MDRQSLDYHAFCLRFAINLINNLEEFVSNIEPNDYEAAVTLLGSLRFIQSRLELWADKHLLTPLNQNYLLSDLSNPWMPTETSVHPDLSLPMPPLEFNSITNTSAGTGPTLDSIDINNASFLSTGTDMSPQSSGSTALNLSSCASNSVSVQTKGLHGDPAGLCGREISSQEPLSSTQSSRGRMAQPPFHETQFTLESKDCSTYPLIDQGPKIFGLPTTQGMGSSRKRTCVQPDLSGPCKRQHHSDVAGPTGNEDARRTAVIKRLQAPPVSCQVPVFQATDPPKAKTVHLAMAMRGHSAISQVWKLQQSTPSRQCVDLSDALIDRSLIGDVQQAALDRGIAICTSANQQTSLLRRLLTWHFAESVECSKGPIAKRASSAVVSQYAGESTRSRYSKLKYRGDLLHMICGSHRGLLPFIPLQRDDTCAIRDPESQYQYSATKKEFKDFEKIFQVNDSVTQVFCAIGTSFLDSWAYRDSCDFKYNDWLSKLQQDFNARSIQSMSDCLGHGVCGCSSRQGI